MTALTIDAPVRIDNATDPTSGALEPESTATVVVVVEGPQGPAGVGAGDPYDDTALYGALATETSEREAADDALASDLSNGLATKASALALSNEVTARQDADTALTSALGGKVGTTDPRLSDARTPLAHAHVVGDTTGLQDALDSKVDDTDPRLSDARTPTTHDHDDRYYTESEVDTLLASAGGGGGGVFAPLEYPWFATTTGNKNESGMTPALGVEYAVLVVINETVTIDGWATRLWSGGASLVCRAGIYADDGHGKPVTTVSEDLGTVPTTTNGFQTVTLATPVTLTPGCYWFSEVQQVGTPSAWVKSVGVRHPRSGATDPISGGLSTTVCAYSRTGSTGTLASNSAAWSEVAGVNTVDVTGECKLPTLYLSRSA